MASFEIVELVEGVPRPFPTGVFPDGKTAASIIESLKLKYPKKIFQPRPIKDETNDWKAREQRRFDEGVYTKIEWDLKPIENHFAYRALKTPTNVAYTPDGAYGKTDRQVSVHVNNYLLKFYPKLTIEQRKKYVWEYCGEKIEDELIITQDADKIEWVYTSGPDSCMSDPPQYYEDTHTGDDNFIHPTRAYGGPDLGIAYILKGNGRVQSRSVVWPEKKIYSTIYGDYDKLEKALILNGYKRGKTTVDWQGARLNTYCFDQGAYLCPYLDFAHRVRYDHQQECLIVDDDGDLTAQHTAGTTYEYD